MYTYSESLILNTFEIRKSRAIKNVFLLWETCKILCVFIEAYSLLYVLRMYGIDYACQLSRK